MWSTKHKECGECHTTNFRHMAKGLCSSCYAKQYKANPERYARIAEQKREWYFKNHEEMLLKNKISREQRWYSGLRERVLKRDKYRCRQCGRPDDLVVHHKDGNGRGSARPNNTMKNLETWCRSCHIDDHRTKLMDARRLRKNGYWSKSLDRCRECGTSERPHRGKGLCATCYMRNRRSKTSA